jgi:hypothetical protein
MAFSAGDQQRIWEAYPSIPAGTVKGRYPGEAITTFEKLIDPNVADTLLGELMVICFRQSAARWCRSLVRHDEFEIEGVRQGHNVPIIDCFDSQTKAFNFWGTAEWLVDYDYVFPVMMLWLIKKYRKFIDTRKYFHLLGYYFSCMGPSIRRQLSGTSEAKPWSPFIRSIILEAYKEYRLGSDHSIT